MRKADAVLKRTYGLGPARRSQIKTGPRESGFAPESIRTNQQMEAVLMSRRPVRFTQGDGTRAIRAAKAAGAPSLQIKPDGTIIVNLLKPIAEQETDQAVEPEEHFVL
jgi:hypothetical protein